MKREIVKIDEELCNGCGLCIPNCHEGALQIIDNKARLISDLMCDGLGACLGHCPEGAITIEKREAEPYNESLVMADMVAKGKNTVIAHLIHLKEHQQTEFLQEGVAYLVEHQSELNFKPNEVMTIVHNSGNNGGHHDHNSHGQHHEHHHVASEEDEQPLACGCPGSQSRSFAPDAKPAAATGSLASALSHWPIQMHLINPAAQHFRNSDLLLAADCTAFTMGSFHPEYLDNKTLAIGCPKLDSGKEIYVEKLKSLVDDAKINTLTVMIMEVPCCGGLIQLAQQALSEAARKVPVKMIMVGVEGEIRQEEWV